MSISERFGIMLRRLFTDFGRLNKMMKAIGYTGAVSVETEGGEDFDEVVALAAKSYAYLNAFIRD